METYRQFSNLGLQVSIFETGRKIMLMLYASYPVKKQLSIRCWVIIINAPLDNLKQVAKQKFGETLYLITNASSCLDRTCPSLELTYGETLCHWVTQLMNLLLVYPIPLIDELQAQDVEGCRRVRGRLLVCNCWGGLTRIRLARGLMSELAKVEFVFHVLANRTTIIARWDEALSCWQTRFWALTWGTKISSQYCYPVIMPS